MSYRAIAESLRNPNGAYFAERTPAMLALEAMVDTVGIRNVVWALAHICREKEQHLATQWGDEHTAKTWRRDARKLDHTAGLIG
jgi:hypothetical protein